VEASWDFTTGQDVLNLVAYKYLQTTDASKPVNVNGFVYYLEHALKVVIVDVQPGSLIITVECGSLQILEELWDGYRAGYISKMARKFLLTKEVLNELGLSKVKFSTSISREKYRACHEQLRAFDSGQCIYFYIYVVSLPSIRTYFSHWFVRFCRALSIQPTIPVFIFRKFPVSSGTTFSGILGTENNLARYTQVSKNFFVPFYFPPGISGIFGCMARISEIQQFSDFPEAFQIRFHTMQLLPLRKFR